jgi:hypothetical protein
MQRSAIVSRCSSRYRDPSNTNVSLAAWAEYVNDAYMDVLAASPFWPFLESRTEALSVTAGTGTVSLPADVFRVTSVYNATDDIAMIPLDGRAEYRHDFPDPASGLGSPQFYRLRNTTLEVYPWAQATTALSVDIFVPPAELGTSDEPVFPEHYHRILVSGALAYAYEDDANGAQAQLHRSSFDRLLMAMKEDLLGSRVEKYPEILDTL